MDSISKPASGETSADALADEGRKVRGFIASNRSDTLLRLFDFLLEQSIEGRRPTETEIVEEVFQYDAARSGGQGSRARVGVYRLRKKLDLYYEDKPGPRLIIPQGEYGFIIKSPDAPEDENDQAANAPGRPGWSRATWAAASALVLANIALVWFHFGDVAGLVRTPARPALWQPFDAARKPTAITIGDYFMFVSKQNDAGMEEVIQDLSIDSADAFYEHVTNTPSVRNSVRNDDLYAVSSDIVGSISALWSYLDGYRLFPVASSDLDPDMMKSSNIVYIGALDALTPLLSNPLFQASQFSCGTTCYELIDKRSGHRFLSDSPYLLGDRIVPRRDYGYIASYPGPSGNQILIVSGTGDAGVAQMADVVTDPEWLKELNERIGGNSRSFEALYQVRTMFSKSYGSSLVMARPIDPGRIWDKAKRSR